MNSSGAERAAGDVPGPKGMRSLLWKLRIGEKLGLSFGFVGLLLLGVVWFYQHTLARTLSDYQRLQQVYAARETAAREIASNLLAASRAEKEFLLRRDEAQAAEVEQHIARIQAEAQHLQGMDERSAATARQIEALIATYNQSFLDIVEAWRTKGLDHNSGLQGAFRDTVHRLQDLARGFEVSPLYLQLLQIRRSEKDLGLRRDPAYQERVRGLLAEFRTSVGSSQLDAQSKARLLEQIEVYRKAFEDYGDRVLDQGDIGGGMGPFRDAAHRMEDLLRSHYVPDLEVRILELRRREKDYLLRLDAEHLALAKSEIARLREGVRDSDISSEDKGLLLDLVAAYERDFLALTAQNERIAWLEQDMQRAAERVHALVGATLVDAAESALRATEAVNLGAARSARLASWVAAAAVLLAILFGVALTRSITRPVLRMADFLDRLGAEEPAERIPTMPEGRDEINAMARSVNRMADHKARMLEWWKASVAEMQAARELLEAQAGASGAPGAQAELAEARQAKTELSRALWSEAHDLAESVATEAAILAAATSAQEEREAAAHIEATAGLLLERLEVLRS